MISFNEYKRLKTKNVELRRHQLHEYQLTAYKHAYEIPFCALFLDLGLGKTPTALTAAVDALLDFEVSKVLVIAPRRVARKTWPDEINKWEHTCMFEYQVIDGTEKEREFQCRNPASIHMISRDNIQWLVHFYKSKWPYDMVIIDESSSFKDHTTKRFKSLKAVVPYIKRMIQLTATPAAESYMHLFAQIYLLDQGERFGRTIGKYQDNYFSHNRYSFKYTLREGAREAITEKISDICLVMKAEDYLDMEKAQFIERRVELTVEQTQQYAQMEKDMIIEVLGDDDEAVTIEAETAASLSSKLMQMASGVIYNTYLDGINEKTGKPISKRDVYELHTAKLDALEEIYEIERNNGNNILVAYHFKSSLERLKTRFPKAVQMDKEGECVTKWNKGKIEMLLAHPQSAGHGLNLQKGGHIIVFYDIPWSLELYLQFIGRLHRQGQTKVVKVIHLIAEGVKYNKKTGDMTKVKTVDGGVVAALNKKEDAQEWLLQRIMRVRQRSRAKKLKEI